MRVARLPLWKKPAIYTAVAEQHGVTVEHLLETIQLRKKFKLYRFYRARTRKRHLEAREAKGQWGLGGYKRTRNPEVALTGQGEMHQLLAICRLTQRAFCEMVGIRESAFVRWYGFPLHPWPIRFLRLFAWTLAARRWMMDNGVDPEQFNPALPTRKIMTGQFPRKPGDLVLDGFDEKPRQPDAE